MRDRARGGAAGRLLAVSVVLAACGLMAGCGGGGGGGAGSATAPQGVRGGAEGLVAPTAGQPSDEGGRLVLGEFQLVSAGPRVIKTGSVTVQVPAGQFERKMQDATVVAAQHGGFVASSRSSGGKLLSGTIVVRVPADQFEAALGELKALGTVKGEELSGQDVTAQFVDLEARLRNWEAQETVLLGLMQRATSIDESIKVQRSLQDVQLAVEQIRGQLRLLQDQTDFGTITLSMSEVVAAPAESGGSSFAKAWRQAVNGLIAAGGGLIVTLGFVLPILLFVGAPFGIGWLLYRRARARSARATG